MPLVTIELLKGKTAEYKKKILDHVHDALTDALKIPDYDRTQRVIEHDPENFEIPEGKSAKYALITIDLFPGRPPEAKKKLYSEIVQRCSVDPGIDPSDIFILLRESPMENWGIRGGKMASETDLGYNLKV